jgi:hypothetical protein
MDMFIEMAMVVSSIPAATAGNETLERIGRNKNGKSRGGLRSR